MKGSMRALSEYIFEQAAEKAFLQRQSVCVTLRRSKAGRYCSVNRGGTTIDSSSDELMLIGGFFVKIRRDGHAFRIFVCGADISCDAVFAERKYNGL